MIQKPEIQYIGQFYLPGSEAPKLKEKKKISLPRLHRAAPRRYYVDPFALAGMAVAAVMLAVLAIGVFRLQSSWETYNNTSDALTEIRRENAVLEHTYRSNLDLDQLRSAAEGMGMIPAEDATIREIEVTVPQEKTGPSWWGNFVWFLSGLFEK